jgi:8-oxo-dGTP diphosphatase
MENQIKIGVNLLLFNEQEQLLMGKRLNVEGAGTWALPGGHLEYGEAFTEGIIRELFEETGLVIEEVVFLNIVNEPRENSHYVQINFISHQWSGSLENKEPDKCEEWKWVPISELPTEIFYAHEPILRAFKAGQSYLEVPLEKK